MNDADERLDKLGDLIARGPRVVIGTREEILDYVTQLLTVAPLVIGDLKNARVPTETHCPMCGTLHVDQDDWAHKIPHRKHQCASCHHIWQPYAVGTVGVDLHVPCRTRRDELLQMVATLSQSVPLESEVGEALNQRGVLLAEVATLKTTNTALVTLIGELQTALKSVCDVATTPLPEDRQTVLAASRLANKAVPL